MLCSFTTSVHDGGLFCGSQLTPSLVYSVHYALLEIVNVPQSKRPSLESCQYTPLRAMDVDSDSNIERLITQSRSNGTYTKNT